MNDNPSDLDYIFNPKTVAIIGATDREGSVGKTLILNLKKSFKGKIIPINPKKKSILELKAYSDIREVKESIDLAVIATPAQSVPKIIQECSEVGIPAAIIISAGFKELGKDGAALENEIEEIVKKSKIRIIGPNCLGVINPFNGLNATFAKDMPLKGGVAFISQSGALGTAVLDWSLKEKVGFSTFVSIGSMVDVDWGDLISYFGKDPHTKSILLYMESLKNAKEFLAEARKVAYLKPVILIKAGKTKESAKAAASHTGALVGNDEVFDIALKRAGVLRVDTISDLFNMAEIVSKQPLPEGPNLAIITNAGGPGVIATDALIEKGGKLASLSDDTYKELSKFLPKAWSHNNPIDILGDATADLYEKTIDVVKKDASIDGMLVILTPQYMTDPTGVAERIKKFSNIGKPILASWMGAKSVEKGKEILIDASIPCFDYPDTACKVFADMYSNSYNLQGVFEALKAEKKASKNLEQNDGKILSIFKSAKAENRTILDEIESKNILELMGIEVVSTYFAKTKLEALEIAKKIGFPVVLKLCSKTITHKSDVGGVILNLKDEEAVIKAYDEINNSLKEKKMHKDFLGVSVQKMIELDGYELILGSSLDSEFGPVLLFGLGGSLVEIFEDKSLALPPLTTSLAKRMMERTKIYKALQGVRGKKKVDMEKLEKILVRFSDLISSYPEIKECDINPLLASSDKIIALDARIILKD